MEVPVLFARKQGWLENVKVLNYKMICYGAKNVLAMAKVFYYLPYELCIL
jgi:hypothetical protein